MGVMKRGDREFELVGELQIQGGKYELRLKIDPPKLSKNDVP